jgi:hypothetical protein
MLRLVLLVLVAFGFASQFSAAADRPPNIVFIFSDDT